MINQPIVSVFVLLCLMFMAVILYEGYLIVFKKYAELAGFKNPEGYKDLRKSFFLQESGRYLLVYKFRLLDL